MQTITQSKFIKSLIPFWTLIEREIFRTKRVLGQAILSPMITASLYIFVFGFVLGSKIETIAGIKYLSFVFPGIFAMNLIMAVFGATSFQVFFMRFGKTIEDFLTLPMSYFELVLSMLVSGVFRALAITFSLTLVAFLFGVNSVVHPFILLFYVVFISIIFGLLGIILGLWADNSFEKISGVTNFFLTPLSFLGGTFYSVSMLPANLQFLVRLNPIFYAIDGIRYAFTGYHDTNILTGLSILGLIAIVCMVFVLRIFQTGWKLRS
jgi:ABC-2 type transport system permease protein